MPTHIDKSLLVKELLLLVADHLLSESLDAEARVWLDQHGAHGHLTTFFHLSEILVVLGPVLGIRDLIHVLAHEVLKLCGLHSLRELLELAVRDVHFATFKERMVHLVPLLFTLGVHADPVEVF